MARVGVFYWHPGRQEVRLFGLSTFAGSVSDGVVRFAGDTIEADFDIYQTTGPRDLYRLWVFNGKDRYRSVLRERGEDGALGTLAEWEYIRQRMPMVPGSGTDTDTDAGEPQGPLEILAPYVGPAWEAVVPPFEGSMLEGVPTRVTLRWVPHAKYVHVRATMIEDSTGVVDGWIYYHTGLDKLRCLALSHTGGVYEGDVGLGEDGMLSMELAGFEGDRETTQNLRLHPVEGERFRALLLGKDGAMRGSLSWTFRKAHAE